MTVGSRDFAVGGCSAYGGLEEHHATSVILGWRQKPATCDLQPATCKLISEKDEEMIDEVLNHWDHRWTWPNAKADERTVC